MARLAQIALPQELVEEIDAAVGQQGRDAFVIDTARAELRRQKLLLFLGSEDAAWKDEDHPELAAGSAAWVRALRRAGDVQAVVTDAE